MADANVLGGSKKIKLDDVAFGARFNGPLVHESVRAELNARRQGTAATKTRGEVRGGGAKPWRQKGTGRARAGSSRSPIWTGGGIVFGPQPRHYTVKVNRKERRAALRSALSVHAERGSIAILDPSPFDEPSTRQAHELIADWAGGGSVLVVLTDAQADVALSFRNLARVGVLPADGVGVADLVGAASLLLTEEALADLTRRAKGENPGAAEPAAVAAEPEPAAAVAEPEPEAAAAEPEPEPEAAADEPESDADEAEEADE
jgi:large subunit ribosomal protein L4